MQNTTSQPTYLSQFLTEIRLFDGTYLEKESHRNESLQKLLTTIGDKEIASSAVFKTQKEDSLIPKQIIDFMTFIVLNNKLKKIREQNIFLKSKLKYRNMNNNNNFIHSFQSNQRTRKRKSEVIRNFPCLYPNCDKAYGSKNSLRQHIRNKHYNYWNNHQGEFMQAQNYSVTNVTQQSGKQSNIYDSGSEDSQQPLQFYEDNEYY